MWLNTGNFFPENIALVRKLAETIPHFLEIKSDVNAFKEVHGLPSDLIPLHNTSFGLMASDAVGTKIVSGYECCSANYWQPTAKALEEIGATLVIRGQRNEEAAKSPIRSGHIEKGVEYLFPIENWTKDEVLHYLESCGFDVPEFFHFEESSLDCINCTAFLHWMEDRKEYMERNHPLEHAKNVANLAKIASIAEAQLNIIKKCAG